MRYPWVNTILLILLPVALVTGYLGLTNGHASRAWLLWVHASAGYAIAGVAVWKGAVIRRSLIRRPVAGLDRPFFLMLTAFALLVLGTGVLWAWGGPIQAAGTSL